MGSSDELRKLREEALSHLTLQRKNLSTFEERSALYVDVRNLLVPGFLKESLRYNGVTITLRTLTFEDLILIESRTGLDDESWYDWVLASSILAIDGQIFMRDQDTLFWLFKRIKEFPDHLRVGLILASSILTDRFHKAKNRCLAYFYERESRDLWMSKGTDLVTGPVFSWVGRNSVQDLWCFYNTLEDDRVKRVFDQSLAAFMVSPHAPKSIKQMNERAKKDEQLLEIDRQIFCDRVYFEAHGISYEEISSRPKFGAINVAVTEDELRQQYIDWTEGKKDLHDNVVEGFQERVRKEAEFRKELAKRKVEEARANYLRSLNETEIPSTYTVLSGEDAQRELDRMYKESQSLPKVFESGFNEKIYNRYIAGAPIPIGKLDKAGRVIEKSPEFQDFEKSSAENPLMEDIKERRPTLGE